MLKLLAKRLLSAIPLLLFLSFVVYLLVDLMPGDAAENLAGDNATPADIEALREQLGLDEALPVRYFEWLGHAVTGDFGISLYSSQPVADLISERIPVTFSLALVTMVIVVLAGLPLGIIAAMRADSLLDRAVTAFASVAMALPPFIIGLVLVIVFAISTPVFPATGYIPFSEGMVSWFQHLVLPALAIAAISTAEVARQTRAAVVDTLSKDFIRTARAKGLHTREIVGKHTLKVAGAPIVTVLGLQISRILAGAVTVEFVFALPGLGTLAVNSVFTRDIPLVLGIVMVMAVVIVIINLVVDLSSGYFNPRVRA